MCFRYLYDFGDYWEHTIEVLDRPMCNTFDYAKCTAGKFRCPPEDVGGFHGFKAFMESMLDFNHPGREENIAWFGKEFNFDFIDLRSINYRLKNLYKYNRDVEQ